MTALLSSESAALVSSLESILGAVTGTVLGAIIGGLLLAGMYHLRVWWLTRPKVVPLHRRYSAVRYRSRASVTIALPSWPGWLARVGQEVEVALQWCLYRLACLWAPLQRHHVAVLNDRVAVFTFDGGRHYHTSRVSNNTVSGEGVILMDLHDAMRLGLARGKLANQLCMASAAIKTMPPSTSVRVPAGRVPSGMFLIGLIERVEKVEGSVSIDTNPPSYSSYRVPKAYELHLWTIYGNSLGPADGSPPRNWGDDLEQSDAY
jgi:hypothetical protein